MYFLYHFFGNKLSVSVLNQLIKLNDIDCINPRYSFFKVWNCLKVVIK